MRGQWMEAAARRLFSPESFALLVEPALADLQIDESRRLADRAEAYATVWIGIVVACDDGVARRTRAFVRENELLTLTALALLHAVHSTWMVVLLLGLDGRVHLGRILGRAIAAVPTPTVLAIGSVVLLCVARAVVTRILDKRPIGHTTLSTYLSQ